MYEQRALRAIVELELYKGIRNIMDYIVKDVRDQLATRALLNEDNRAFATVDKKLALTQTALLAGGAEPENQIKQIPDELIDGITKYFYKSAKNKLEANGYVVEDKGNQLWAQL